jgi:hypothetical protein
LTGRDEIREANEILYRRESSREHLKSRKERYSKNYSGDTAVVVTKDEGPELAAIYDATSDNEWQIDNGTTKRKLNRTNLYECG